jgi:hypothetical protein
VIQAKKSPEITENGFDGFNLSKNPEETMKIVGIDSLGKTNYRSFAIPQA